MNLTSLRDKTLQNIICCKYIFSACVFYLRNAEQEPDTFFKLNAETDKNLLYNCKKQFSVKFNCSSTMKTSWDSAFLLVESCVLFVIAKHNIVNQSHQTLRNQWCYSKNSSTKELLLDDSLC